MKRHSQAKRTRCYGGNLKSTDIDFELKQAEV